MTQNLLLGRPLVFGDPEQMKALKEAKDPWPVTNHGGSPPYGEDPFWMCICCGIVNQARKVMPLPFAEWRNHQMIRTPWIYYCKECCQGVLFWRSNLEYEYDSDLSLFARYVRGDEKINIREFAHPTDPIKFYNWKR